MLFSSQDLFFMLDTGFFKLFAYFNFDIQALGRNSYVFIRRALALFFVDPGPRGFALF
jgi:hypothetical protein